MRRPIGPPRDRAPWTTSLRSARWIAIALAMLGAISLMVPPLSARYRLGINGSDSLPGLLYLVLKQERPARRGDLVAFYPPANHFYPARMVFIKHAEGLPGDRVARRGRDFFINGRYRATAKTHARNGRPLRPGPSGVLPPGRYFVWTPHPDSLDSRYEDIGWIAHDRILGRAVRLF